jgi:hypothetical protein
MRYRGQPTFDVDEVRPRVRAAFAALRTDGFIARMNFLCCQGCGCYAIGQMVKERGGDPDSGTTDYAFYHNQDNESLRDGQPFYIAWGGRGELIAQRLREQGLEVEWDGTQAQRICVKGLTPPEPDATYLDLVQA